MPDTPAPVQIPFQRRMGFRESVASCFRKFLVFRGRATRAEFWWFQLFSFLLYFAAGVIFFVGHAFHNLPQGEDTYRILLTVYHAFSDYIIPAATIFPNWAVTVRRLHDINRSGWWALLNLTIIGIIPLIIFTCLPSRPEANRFGPVPCTDSPEQGAAAENSVH